jgi:hypothetical protein
VSVVALPGMAAWGILEEALRTRRPVALRYHDSERLTCPHVLGFKSGRARVLCYQAAGATSTGRLPADPTQRWRNLFIDEIEAVEIAEGAWQTAANYAPATTNGFDHIVIAIGG